jgi:hypothetical protein
VRGDGKVPSEGVVIVRLGWEGHGLMFVRELLIQKSAEPDGEATAMTVADAIDMDERESVNVMGWLVERELVCEAASPGQAYCDAYTTAPLAPTARGRSFAETGTLPVGREMDWPAALDNLSKRLRGPSA